MRDKFLLFFVLFLSSVVQAQDFDIYVSDAGNFHLPPWQILKYDSNGKNPEVFIDSPLNWPQDILFIEDQGVVLISSFGSGKITKHDAATGDYISDFASGISGPTRMKIGPNGLLYVLQWQGNGKVLRYTLSGIALGAFTLTGVQQSIGMDWDSDGNLYVSSYELDSVRKFDKDGKDLGVFINHSLAGPTNIWFDESGDLLVADYDGTSVKRFDAQGNFKSNFITGLRNCEGVAVLPSGNILVGNGATSSVKQYDSEGNYVNEFVTPGLGSLKTPNAVTVRMKSLNAVEDISSIETAIVYPTSGNMFNIRNEWVGKIKSAEIYTYDGKSVKSISSVNDTLLWNANGVAAGVYIMRLTTMDNHMLTQRIQVIR